MLRVPQIIKLSTEEMCVHIESAAVNFLDALMQDKLIYIDKADKGTAELIALTRSLGSKLQQLLLDFSEQNSSDQEGSYCAQLLSCICFIQFC